MQLIHIDLDTMHQALTSANFDSYMQAVVTLMDEGFFVQITQQYANAPTEHLFQIDSSKEFEEWVKKGCPSTWEKK